MWRSNQLSYRTNFRAQCLSKILGISNSPASFFSLYRKTDLRSTRRKQTFSSEHLSSKKNTNLNKAQHKCQLFQVNSYTTIGNIRSRKEVFQPHLPVRLPCYDLAPITSFALGRSLRSRTSGTPGFHGLTGGVYKARERIHRAMADARLLANPASRSRVADSDPN